MHERTNILKNRRGRKARLYKTLPRGQVHRRVCKLDYRMLSFDLDIDTSWKVEMHKQLTVVANEKIDETLVSTHSN